MKGSDGCIALRVLFLAIATLPLPLAEAAQNDAVVTVSTSWSQTAVRPGGEIGLAVVLDIRQPFHISANSAKPPFVPTEIEIISAPAGLRSSTPTFPEPSVIDFGVGDAKEKISVFSPRAVVFIPMVVNDAARLGQALIKLKVSYQACDDMRCLLPASVE